MTPPYEKLLNIKLDMGVIFCSFVCVPCSGSISTCLFTFFITVSEMSTEDFVCTVRSDTETEHSKVANSLSVSVKEARRDPETGIVTLTLNVVCAPLKPCRLQYYTSTVKYTQWPLCLVHLASTGLDFLLP